MADRIRRDDENWCSTPNGINARITLVAYGHDLASFGVLNA